MSKTQILDSSDIKQKTVRIAYQIVEENYHETELVLIGIIPNGFEYARRLKKQIEAISELKINLIELTIDKSNPLEKQIELNLGKKTLNNKVVVLIDDVANTGKTMYYALKPIMDFSPKKVQAVVLVDRQHKLFPITPDFVGMSLSTTLREHIKVEFIGNEDAKAYLV
jgi:pyrimidine operon attenuation protein/uracil phosphoribosyltransferase